MCDGMSAVPSWLRALQSVAPQTAKFAQAQLAKSQAKSDSATTQAKLSNDMLSTNANASYIVSSLSNFVGDIGRQAQNFVTGDLSGLVKAFENLPSVLKTEFDNHTKNISDFVNHKISDTQKSVESFSSEASKKLSDFATESQKAVDSAIKYVNDTKDMLVGEFAKQSESINGVLGSVKEFVGDSVSRAVSESRIAIENVSKQFGDAIVQAIENTENVITVVVSSMRESIDSTIKAVSDSLNDSLLALSLGFDVLTKAFMDVWQFDAEKFVSQQIAVQREVAKRQMELVGRQ